MNPLNSVSGTITGGVILAVVIGLVLAPFNVNEDAIIVWLHVLAGITWIGLLYYFNFVQVPAMADAAADEGGPGGAGISKYVAPRALWWFRWGAAVTWITGVAYLWRLGILGNAAALGLASSDVEAMRHLVIGLGGWLGTVMLFNVWVLIWPNQKKILGMVEATAEEIAKGRRVAFLASRTNTLLSVPMVMCMVGYAHGGLLV